MVLGHRLIVVVAYLNAHLVSWTGVSMNDINVEQAECDLDDRVYWLVHFPVYVM